MSFWIILLLILIGFFVGFAFGGFLFSRSIEDVSQKHADAVKHITRSYDERARRSREANKSVLNYVTGGTLGAGTSEDVDDSVEETLGAGEDFSTGEFAEEVGDEVVNGFDNDTVEDSVEESSDSGEDVFADEVGSALVKDSGEEFDTDSSEFDSLTVMDVAAGDSSEIPHEDAVEGDGEEAGDECDTVNSASYMEDSDEDVPEESSDSGEDVFADEVGSALVKDSGEEFDTDSSEFDSLTVMDVAAGDSSEIPHEDAVEGDGEEAGDECDTVNSASYMEDSDEDVPEESVPDTFVEEDVFDAPVSHAIDLDDLNSEDEELFDVEREEYFEISPEKLDSSTEVEKDVPVRGDDASGSSLLIPLAQSAAESETPRVDEEKVPVEEEKNLIDGSDGEFESLSKGFDFEEGEFEESLPVEDNGVVEKEQIFEPAEEVENAEDRLIGSIGVEALMRAEIAKKFPASETN